ncbi:MAG: hypothetical protein WBI55_03255, partial [Eubacteriales bacterium]
SHIALLIAQLSGQWKPDKVLHHLSFPLLTQCFLSDSKKIKRFHAAYKLLILAMANVENSISWP